MQLPNVGAKLASNKKNEKDETWIHGLFFYEIIIVGKFIHR